MKPQLDEKGIKLFLVSIGTYERSKDFVQHTGFPAGNLLVDPHNVSYEALGLYNSVVKTFFSWETPLAIKKRIDEGNLADIGNVLKNWKPWIPPKSGQANQQGGMFIFEGRTTLFSHKDQATSAHADLNEVLGIATKIGEDCGCDTKS